MYMLHFTVCLNSLFLWICNSSFFSCTHKKFNQNSFRFFYLENNLLTLFFFYIYNSDSLTLVCRNLSSKLFFFGFINGLLDLDVDELCGLWVVSFVPRSAELNIVLKIGYLFPIPCLTFLSKRTCGTKMKKPCSEFAMTNKYWNTTAFSLTARIPNSQVTPRAGKSVPSDRRPDEAFLCSEDLATMLEANSTLKSETIIRMLITLMRQTGIINK